LDESRQKVSSKILEKYKEKFEILPGSINKHQAWPGGYKDHIEEVMNIAILLYDALGKARELSFTLKSALFILFLHDLDKLERYALDENSGFKRTGTYENLADTLKETLSRDFEYVMTDEEYNALKYIHSEGEDYSPDKRIMGPLAAFVHCCDTISTRIWHDHGKNLKIWVKIGRVLARGHGVISESPRFKELG